MGSIFSAIISFFVWIIAAIVLALVHIPLLKIPVLLTLAHTGISIFLLLEGRSNLETIVLFLVLLNCLNEMRIIITYRLFVSNKNTPDQMPIIAACIFVSAVPATIMWRGDGINIPDLLFWIVAARAIFVFFDIHSALKILPEARKLLKDDGIHFFNVGNSSWIYNISGYIHLMLNRSDEIVTNLETIKSEKEKGLKNIQGKYKTPASRFDKLTEGRHAREKREGLTSEVEGYDGKHTFISSAGFRKFCIEAENRLKKCSKISPHEFVKFKFPEHSQEWLPMGVEFFVIMAFAPLVKSGKIIDENISGSIAGI